MKIFISADIEGIAGIMSPEHCSPQAGEYQRARALMEGEVNAAIRGAYEGGATEVVVADSHAQMINLHPENMDPRARLVQGKPRVLSMAEGIEQQHYDGLFLIGYHTAAGEFGTLAHTINGRAYARVKINDTVMAEADIYATVAAEHGTPLLLTSGDNLLEKWMRERYPNSDFVCVKRAIARNATESLSPALACEKIETAAKVAVSKLAANAYPLKTVVSAPYHLDLTVTNPGLADIFCLIPGVERLSATQVGYKGETMGVFTSLLGAFSYLASTQN